MPLEEIRRILDSPDYDRLHSLEEHRSALLRQKERLNLLIRTVSDSILEMKGQKIMHDTDKFEGLKKEAIDKNEKEYGSEVRQRFGDEMMDESNKKLGAMDEQKWNRRDALEAEILKLLAEAADQGDPVSDTARRLCERHREWLELNWPDGAYSKEAHLGLAEAYTADPRFAAYYEKAAPGGAEYLKEALTYYCCES